MQKSIVIRRPDGMSPDEFQQLVSRVVSEHGTRFRVDTGPDEVILAPYLQDREMGEVLSTFTATVPQGMTAVAAVLQLPPGRDVRELQPDNVLAAPGSGWTLDEALDRATHVLVIEFGDRQGYVLAGERDAVRSFLASFERGRDESEFWQDAYHRRKAVPVAQ